MVKVTLCFIVYNMCNFIHVGNTSVIVIGSCLVYTVNKELGNTDPASVSILDSMFSLNNYYKPNHFNSMNDVLLVFLLL